MVPPLVKQDRKSNRAILSGIYEVLGKKEVAKKGGIMKKILLLSMVITILFSFLNAEIYIKTKSHTGAFELMGQKRPERVDYSDQWIAGNKMVHIREQGSVIIDLDKKAVFIIYHEPKTYVEAPLPLEMKKLLPTEMLAMMSMWKVSAKTTASGETKKIKKWNCNGYNVDITMGMMSMKIKTWATKDIPINWKDFSTKFYPILLQAVLGQVMDEDTLNQYLAVDGFQVYSEITVNIMNQEIKSTREVVEIADKPAPAGVFSVPAGYKKQDKIIIQKWGI